ncbi:DUF819 family protein [uncultured Eudoraea sp.]|jgi:uncharacterized membrane protein|uniref:DUF819 family protein n=1 Tax=uncultured Eudoraea sp. TaxID=1035614 RepID=UPI002621CA2F|nr:DUF819 family protein [uncultured Eudoraea sp.]
MIPWLISGFTVILVYFLNQWENKHIKSLLDWFPAILFAYLIPAGITALMDIDLSQDEIHDYSKLYFIPLAIIAVMSSLSFLQLKSIGWKPIAVFVAGSFWIAVFPFILALFLLDSELISELFINQEYWKGIPPIVGGWIGGSTSQLVLKELVECPENIFLTVLVMDNILVNIWTILMFQGIKESDFLNRKLKITNLSMPEAIKKREGKSLSPLLCFLILTTFVFIINALVDSFVIKIIVLSAIGLLLSSLIKNWNFGFVLKFGGILILVVMAVLGLKLKFSLVEFELGFLGFMIVWLLSHFIILLLVAKLLNVNTAWVPIASMANVGGIATAPAVTAAYEPKWMPHAIILAILSMATGTFWGMLTIFLFRSYFF